MDWLTSIPKRQFVFICLSALVGFALPFLLVIASLPTKAVFGAILVGLAFLFAETIIEWFLDIAKDTFSKPEKTSPRTKTITRYAHAKVAAFSLACAVGWPIALHY